MQYKWLADIAKDLFPGGSGSQQAVHLPVLQTKGRKRKESRGGKEGDGQREGLVCRDRDAVAESDIHIATPGQRPRGPMGVGP